MLATVPQKMESYLKLARIHNMIPSMLLVVVGAWVSVLAHPCVSLALDTTCCCCCKARWHDCWARAGQLGACP